MIKSPLLVFLDVLTIASLGEDLVEAGLPMYQTQDAVVPQ